VYTLEESTVNKTLKRINRTVDRWICISRRGGKERVKEKREQTKRDF
jgi:hypothetical protein